MLGGFRNFFLNTQVPTLKETPNSKEQEGHKEVGREVVQGEMHQMTSCV